MPPRARLARFYLVSLLANLPRERLIELDQVWGVTDPGERGLVATLYRRMTDADVRHALIARLPDDVRLVFQRLARSGQPLSRADLLRALPFSEERIEHSLAGLEAVGLVWSGAPDARGRVAADREWFVPVELRDVPRSALPMPSPRTLRKPEPGALPTAPELRTIDTLPGVIRPRAHLSRIVSDLDRIGKDGSEVARSRADLLGFAEHCGLALGVWIRDGRQLRAGPRAASWQQLTSVERARALARLWLVDDRSPRHVPAHVRRAFWQVLTLAEENTWYDVNSVARRVAWQLAFAGTGRGDDVERMRGLNRRGSIARRDLETAIDILGWIGVVLVADAARARPVAIQLTGDGRRALAQDQESG